MNAAPSTNQSKPRPFAETFLTPGKVFFFLACYFLLQAIVRTLVSPAAELDESEQLVLTQVFRWGYGAQPPLYTWLQKCVFSATGPSIAGLASLKAVLLFGIYFFVYRAAREMSRNENVSVISALSLLLIPQFLWESQRDLTHSIVATLMSAATLWVFVRLLKNSAPKWFLLLGICAGLGTLGKYNYCFFLGALVVAACSISEFRRKIISPWLLLSVAVFLLITAPHFLWIFQENGMAAIKAQAAKENAGYRGVLKGIFSLAKATVAFLILLVPTYIFLFRKPAERARNSEAAPCILLLKRTLLIALVFALGLVLLFKTQFKERWMQPILFATPILLALLVEPKLDRKKIRILVTFVSILAIGVLIAVPAIPLSAALTNRPTRLNASYKEFSAPFQSEKPSAIVAGSRLVGGNLRLFFPDSVVVSPEFSALRLPNNEPWLVVWDATKIEEPPESMLLLLRNLGVTDTRLQNRAFISAHFLYSKSGSMRLGYARVNPARNP